jgi:chemotaxis family two-component system response regulator PixH
VSKPILVIDDDLDILETLKRLLEDAGYSVTCAASVHEALAELDRARPCLILLDLMMPERNAWDFRVEQQRRLELASIPVVVMTASAIAPSSILASAFLRKPLDLAELRDTIGRLCRPSEPEYARPGGSCARAGEPKEPSG